jgi:hypothetical protein
MSASGGEACCRSISGSPVGSARTAAAASVARGFFTWPRALACFSSKSRSAAWSTCSVVAFGMACERPSLALSSSFRNSRLTVIWSRRRSAVSGSTSSRMGGTDIRSG